LLFGRLFIRVFKTRTCRFSKTRKQTTLGSKSTHHKVLDHAKGGDWENVWPLVQHPVKEPLGRWFVVSLVSAFSIFRFVRDHFKTGRLRRRTWTSGPTTENLLSSTMRLGRATPMWSLRRSALQCSLRFLCRGRSRLRVPCSRQHLRLCSEQNCVETYSIFHQARAARCGGKRSANARERLSACFASHS